MLIWTVMLLADQSDTNGHHNLLFFIISKKHYQRHCQENTVGAHCRLRVTYKSAMLVFVSRVFSLPHNSIGRM